MTLKELGSCDHVRRGDRVIEFSKNGQIYRAICPQCGSYMRWDNWSHLDEPLRARCSRCMLFLSSTELNLELEKANAT
jgi:uncharacterized OB-fold protein